MNLTDLQHVLRERSADPAGEVIHDLRLHGVRAKVAARRRRRQAAWGAGVVVVLAVAAAVVIPRGGQVTPGPADPPPVRMIEGFPEYANGARVIAARSADLAAGRIELTLIPEAVDLVIFTRCSDVGRSGVTTAVTVNGRPTTSGGCSTGTSARPAMDEVGVAVGEPANVVMTVGGGSGSDPIGTFGLAIGERVPFVDYPLPPRPEELRRLDEALPAGCTEATCPGTLIIRSDPADPTRPVSRTVTWQTLRSIEMVAQTPGLLHVRVSGVTVVTGEWWDYGAGGYGTFGDEGGGWSSLGVDPTEGDRVTVEIVPEHITGAWQVVLTPTDVAD
jgi:hypothetical protein